MHIRKPPHCFGLFTLYLLFASGMVRADGPPSVSAPGLNISISAVDPGIFHLVAALPGNPNPPVSPFVVETADWRTDGVGRRAAIPHRAWSLNRAFSPGMQRFGAVCWMGDIDSSWEWLVGDRLLAAPILAAGGARDVYLPAGGWYDFNTGAPVAGGRTLHVQAPLDTIPAYVRAGTILPLGPVLQSTSLGVEDPLEVRVYPGADAGFALYEDDGGTYAYQRGASSRIPMHWDDKSRTLTVSARAGSFPGMLSTRHLRVVLPDGSRKTITYTGRPARIKF